MSDVAKAVVVTGGGKGLGRAYSLALAGAGWRVAVADLDHPAAQATAGEIRKQGGTAAPFSVDVSRWKDVEEVFGQARDELGGLDALVNNAAIYATLTKKPFAEIGDEEWDRVMAVNLRGAFNCCKAALPHLRERGGGKIVNVSSSTVFQGTPFFLHYVTSKAGMIGLTRALAREVGDDGICVNALAPGLTLSGTNDAELSEEYLATRARQRCLKRNQLPQDLVGAVLFLCSDASDFLTGQTFVVDGGIVMR